MVRSDVFADIIELSDVFGECFVQIYGQGECPMAISVLSREAIADRRHLDGKTGFSSAGAICCGVEIADPNGNPFQSERWRDSVCGAPMMKN